MLTEDVLTPELLLSTIHNLYDHRDTYIQAMEKSELSNAIEKITDLIDSCAGKNQ